MLKWASRMLHSKILQQTTNRVLEMHHPQTSRMMKQRECSLSVILGMTEFWQPVVGLILGLQEALSNSIWVQQSHCT